MIKITEEPESLLLVYKNNNQNTTNIKKMLACTNLSKLNNSSQSVVGMYCPGVQHKIKIMSVQITATNKLYFKINFNIKTKNLLITEGFKHIFNKSYAPINAL